VKTNDTLLLLFLLSAQITFGQIAASKEIQGQIVVQSTPAEGVNIINSTTQVMAISDVNGMFSIVVKEGDVLVFSSVNLDPVNHRIISEDVKSNSLQIKMTVKEMELKEVIVNENSKITAENLGIIPEGQKKYTPAERKLATAGDFKPVHLLGLLGGSMQLDPVINKINGRTKKMKELIEVEKKENNIKQLGYLFEETYFVDYLKIPLDQINGFKFYIVENEQAASFLETKDKTKLTFLMSELALKYNEILSGENK